MRFADLIAPDQPDDFLGSTFGQQPRHFDSPRPRFGELLPWQRLNDIISRYRLTYPRIRVAKHGSRLPPEMIFYSVVGRRGTTIPRVNMRALQKALADGAMLIVDTVDEMVPEIESLAKDVERACGEHVWVNAYVGWNETQGFATHWDDHDSFILQVRGRKAWRVYHPTVLHPLRAADWYPDPSGEPVMGPPSKLATALDVDLQEGDVLHIPRGWWHDARPFTEPSVHLTVAVTCRTGIDVLDLVRQRLSENSAFRKNIPRFGSGAERDQYLAELGRELQAQWSTVTLTEAIEYGNSLARGRLAPSLPWAVTDEPLTEAQTLTWLPARCSVRLMDDAVLIVTANVQGRYQRAAEPIINMLIERSPILSAELLMTAARIDVESTVVTSVVRQLARDGLLRVSSAN